MVHLLLTCGQLWLRAGGGGNPGGLRGVGGLAELNDYGRRITAGRHPPTYGFGYLDSDPEPEQLLHGGDDEEAH